jgi:hypothetical protein
MARSIQTFIPEGGKLAALRARTDRDLARLVLQAVEAGFRLAQESAYDDAEALYLRVAPLLPLIEEMPSAEAAAARRQAAELRSELDQAALAGSGILS